MDVYIIRYKIVVNRDLDVIYKFIIGYENLDFFYLVPENIRIYYGFEHTHEFDNFYLFFSFHFG